MSKTQNLMNIVTKQETGTVEWAKERTVGKRPDSDIHVDSRVMDDQGEESLYKSGGRNRNVIIVENEILSRWWINL